MKILHLFTFTAPYYWQSVLSETIIYLFAGININKQAQSLRLARQIILYFVTECINWGVSLVSGVQNSQWFQ